MLDYVLFLFFVFPKKGTIPCGSEHFSSPQAFKLPPQKGIRGTSQSSQLVFLASFIPAPIHFHSAEENSTCGRTDDCGAAIDPTDMLPR
jgi:hypothetical protein